MTRSNSDTYDMLLKLVKTRMSVRKFRSDPIPEGTINKILEVADGRCRAPTRNHGNLSW